LRTLHLYNCNFGEEGAKAIAQLLVETTSLRALYLNNNRIGTAGFDAVCEALTRNRTLRKLVFSANPVTSIAGLAPVLQVHPLLREIYLSDVLSRINVDTAESLHYAMERNDTLRKLYFGLTGTANREATEHWTQLQLRLALNSNRPWFHTACLYYSRTLLCVTAINVTTMSLDAARSVFLMVLSWMNDTEWKLPASVLMNIIRFAQNRKTIGQSQAQFIAGYLER
jgi:hypothetical protein